MIVTVVTDLQNGNEILGVYSESPSKVRTKAIADMMEEAESKSEARYMVEEMWGIEGFTVRKYT